jgi:signal peptidase I
LSAGADKINLPLMPDESSPAAPTKLTWTSPVLRMRVLGVAFLLAALCYAFFTWVLWPVKVLGDSMLPTFRNGERRFINKLAYWNAAPLRGDVIALYAPNGDIYIKRVVGLPGETITFTNGALAINGHVLTEPYVDSKVVPREGEEGRREQGLLDRESYFVIGDNRATSVRGKVTRQAIIGKLAF